MTFARKIAFTAGAALLAGTLMLPAGQQARAGDGYFSLRVPGLSLYLNDRDRHYHRRHYRKRHHGRRHKHRRHHKRYYHKRHRGIGQSRKEIRERSN